MSPPSRPIKNIVVLGATGNVGVPIVEGLIAHPAEYTVTALTRKTSNASFPKEVRIAQSDYSKESLSNIFADQDAVISCVPNARFDFQKPFIDAAIESGVIRFVPSEFGLDTANPTASEYIPLLGEKQKTVDYLRSKEDRISWSAVITGTFFDWSLDLPSFGWDLKNNKAAIYDGGDVEYEATNVGHIGKAVAALLSPEHQAATANQHIHINSFTLTQNRVLQALENISGRKFEVTKDTTAGLRQRSLDKLKEEPGDRTAMLGLIISSCYGQGGINRYSKDAAGGLWNERLGLSEEGLEDAIRQVIVK